MSKTTLEAAFDGFRPKIPRRATSALETLLGTHKIQYAQAHWVDPSNERGLEVDVFTSRHRINAKLAEDSGSASVSVTALVFAEVRSDGDEWSIALGNDTVRLFRSTPTYSGGDGPALFATDHPDQFLRWAVTHGTWA